MSARRQNEAIEAVLRDDLEAARAAWIHARNGTDLGAKEQCRAVYAAALRDFEDFILLGKIPPKAQCVCLRNSYSAA